MALHVCHLHVFFECQLDADVVSSLYCSLESIHAALAIMAHDGMPKQIYNEEVTTLTMTRCLATLSSYDSLQNNSVVEGARLTNQL